MSISDFLRVTASNELLIRFHTTLNAWYHADAFQLLVWLSTCFIAGSASNSSTVGLRQTTQAFKVHSKSELSSYAYTPT